jgi:hypothetical protein
MIEDNGKYYLYRYVRLDKNVPFYIGIGTKTNKKRGFQSYKSEYHRAFSKHHSVILDKIKTKTLYNVEILLESNNYEFIKQKEIEFVKLYGRINKNNGSLANLTEGGDGTVGTVVSEETRRKIGENNSLKGKFGKNHRGSKRVYQYDLEGNFIKEWESLSDVGKQFNKNKRTPSFKGKTFKGYRWFYKFMGNKIDKIDYQKGVEKRLKSVNIAIYQYDENLNFIERYESITSAANKTGISVTGIFSAVNRKNNKCCGYIFTKELIQNHVNS